MKKKYRKIIVGGILIIVLIVLVLYQLGAFSGSKINPGNAYLKESQTEKVRTAKVEEKEVPIEYTTIGTIHSRNDIEVSSRLTARIEKVYCRNGDKIKKGQILAVLENNELNAAVSKAQMKIKSINARINVANESIRAANAELKRAKAEYVRNKTLSKTNAVPYKLFEQAESKYTQAAVAVKQAELNLAMALSDKQGAESALQEAETMLSYSKIKSPINGVIAEEFADPGDIALPGKILFKIFEPSTLVLEIPVRESLIKKVKTGDKISFYVSALKKKYTGDVREIVPFVDHDTRTFLVKVCIGNDLNLVPGMYGEAKIKLGTEKEIVIPAKAVTRVGQLETVRLWRSNGKIKKIYVKTVKSKLAGFRRVLSGLKAGDTVVL